MAAQLTRSPETTLPGSVRQPRRWLWLAALLTAMATAAVLGVAVAAHVTRPAPANPEPNTNAPEVRVPTLHAGQRHGSRP